MSRCVFNLGYHYYLQHQSDKAQKFFEQSLSWAEKSKNHKILSMAHNQLGLLWTDRGKFNEALKEYLLAIDIAQQHDLFKNKCATLVNIGSLYEYQKDTVKALKYYLEAEKIAKKNHLKEILLSTYGSIAIIKRKSDIPLSLNYYQRAYQIAKEIDDRYEQFNTLINLSYGYLALNSETGNRQAFECLKKAEQTALALNDKENLFYVHFNIGAYHFNLKQYAKALQSYQTSLSFYQPTISIDQKINLYDALIEVYKKTEDYRHAYDFQQKQNALKDSIFNIEKTKSFNEIQTRYAVEKKNLRIRLLSKEKQIERNQKRTAIYIGLMLIIPMLLLLLFYKHRIKTQNLLREKENKIFVQEKEQLKQEQELKRITGVLQGQDQERNRIAQEIHDGVGGKLAGIKLHLSQINTTIANDKIQDIINGISGVFTELRAISHDLSQNYIHQQSLQNLIQELIVEYNNRKEFQTDLHLYPVDMLETLPQEIKHHLYRILQELLANIAKHAQAKQVYINLTRHENSINLIVEDDGIGYIDTGKTGIGIKNIQERLQSLGGTLHMESHPGQGSCSNINVPIL
ncbi:tetratricopeptide repeat protein [Flavobacterium sp. CYK-4]|uniref:tetratricopeptide repeat-containing sensor histidine kinase n=1 Tax=Flavobacterium lotistagni TaxID=2709660 RepID=UPI00140D4757|nr:sensor histidine kinase [Flavobacterium lotistagni]NHM05680.1 tetratricopeptide repeat protein [Flavobacterium lotistagni]